MSLFTKILIANRGEIAARIARTARRMGIPTVAVFAPEEHDALHVRMADEAIELKGGSLAETYLDSARIISIAKETGASAIHPGYGFLSENETFAGACEKAGITFIGPRSETIELMGNKTRARETALKAGLPVIEGYTGSPGELIDKGSSLKFPVLVKAAAGGGGKGMRIVYTPEELPAALEATSREALTYFGSSDVYLEQYLENPRHIEVQILGDNHGNIIHLFERECSIQRRYQKIIEESPSPAVTRKMRDEITGSAIRLARAIGYRNAGTIEFLADNNGNFYFLEMNTRIQVEHPVTEAITQIDLVEEQILVAAGQKLRHTQESLTINGHAIECRIYSEDPASGFIPLPGKITYYQEPHGKGIRVDSAYDNEGEVGGNYDPMIGKLITHGAGREEARKLMTEALGNYGIHGIKTNISFLQSIMHHDDFIRSDFSTTWCEKSAVKINEAEKQVKDKYNWRVPAISALLASMARKEGKNPLWDNLGYWRGNRTIRFCFEGETTEALIHNISQNSYDLRLGGVDIRGSYSFENGRMILEFEKSYHNIFISENNEGLFIVTYMGFGYFFRRFDFLKKKDFFVSADTDTATASGAIYSPMPGRIIKVNKTAGKKVKRGDILVIVESMKMENNILAPSDGIIESIEVKPGGLIDGTLPLLIIKQNDTL